MIIINHCTNCCMYHPPYLILLKTMVIFSNTAARSFYGKLQVPCFVVAIRWCYLHFVYSILSLLLKLVQIVEDYCVKEKEKKSVSKVMKWVLPNITFELQKQISFISYEIGEGVRHYSFCCDLRLQNLISGFNFWNCVWCFSSKGIKLKLPKDPNSFLKLYILFTMMVTIK